MLFHSVIKKSSLFIIGYFFIVQITVTGIQAQDSSALEKIDPEQHSSVEKSDVPKTQIDTAGSSVTLQEIRVGAKRAKSDVEKTIIKKTAVMLGTFGNRNIADMPYSIHIVSSNLVNSVQAINTSDALKYIPVVQSQTGGSLTTDYFCLRGFTSSVWTYNISLDGMRIYNPYEVIDDKEQIEVLTGANSFVYGITSPGGMINYVQKRPDKNIGNSVTVGFMTGSEGVLKTDIGGLIGKKLAYRLNSASYNGETSTEDQKNRQYSGTGAIDWHILPNLTWSFDASMLHREVDHTQALFMIGKATVTPDAPDISKNYGGSYGFTDDNYARGNTGIKWFLDSLVMLRAMLRCTEFDRAYTITRRSFTDNSGDYTVRIDYQGKNENYVPQGNVLLESNFSTGMISHKLSAGYTCDLLITKTSYPNASFVYTASKVYGAWSDYPDEPDTAPAGDEPRRKTEKMITQTLGISDYLKAGKISAIAGLTRASIQDSLWTVNTGFFSQVYDKAGITPNLALMYSPINNSNIYVSYNRGLQRGSIAPATSANAQEVLPPFVASQWEGGFKYGIGTGYASIALFRVAQDNAYIDPVTNVYSADGSEVHKGIELTLFGKIIPDLFVSGGAIWQNATTEKTSTASLKDKTPQGVAEKMAKLYAEYALPMYRKLNIGAGLSYTGKEWVDVTNKISIPSVTTGDLGLSFKTAIDNNHIITVHGNVTNVANKAYWTTRSGILYPGTSRMFSLTINYML
jgi:iron complex outermembrane recepter protein